MSSLATPKDDVGKPSGSLASNRAPSVPLLQSPVRRVLARDDIESFFKESTRYDFGPQSNPPPVSGVGRAFVNVPPLAEQVEADLSSLSFKSIPPKTVTPAQKRSIKKSHNFQSPQTNINPTAKPVRADLKGKAKDIPREVDQDLVFPITQEAVALLGRLDLPGLQTQQEGYRLNPYLIEDDGDDSSAEELKMKIFNEGLRSLAPREYLNDSAISVLMAKIVARSPRFGAIDSQTSSTVLTWPETPPWVERRHRKHFGDKEVLFVPLNMRYHWVLFVYDTKGKLEYYDSLPGMGLFQEAWRDFQRFWGVASPRSPIWEPVIARCPTQPNGFDCGLHVLRNAEIIVTRETSPGPTVGEPPLESSQLRKYYKGMYSNGMFAA